MKELPLHYRIAKRCLDLFVSLTAMLVFAPVFVVVAVLVRLRLGSPVIFRQPRPGLNEAIFPCFKFRTMTNGTDANGELLPDAERITAFGKFLRATSLDELPQLWSVLVGDMSLVGPRPLVTYYLPRYSDEQKRRHEVKPGITGWAQVNGRNEIDWDRKLALDVWYVDHCSFWLDLKILAMTVGKVLTASGVSKAGQVSMEEFLGPGMHSKQSQQQNKTEEPVPTGQWN